MEKNSLVKEYKLSDTFLDEAERIVTRSNISFIYDRKTSRGEITDPNVIDNGQIIHHLYYDNQPKCQYYNFFKTVFDETKIPVKQMLRMKINVTFPLIGYMQHNHQMCHQDINNPEQRPDLKFKSLIVYINKSDGDTMFFENNKIKERVSHERGKAILFDSNLLHAGQNPMKHNTRIVLNTIFTQETN